MKVEVIPEAVAENEGVGFGGFGITEEAVEAGEFFGGDGEADHLFDWEMLAHDREKVVVWGRKMYS